MILIQSVMFSTYHIIVYLKSSRPSHCPVYMGSGKAWKQDSSNCCLNHQPTSYISPCKQWPNHHWSSWKLHFLQKVHLSSTYAVHIEDFEGRWMASWCSSVASTGCTSQVSWVQFPVAVSLFAFPICTHGSMAFVVEPVLAYVKAFNQRADQSEVHSAVLNCYDSAAICKAKYVLWAECGAKLEVLKLEKICRWDTSSWSQAEADLEDIQDTIWRSWMPVKGSRSYTAKPIIYSITTTSYSSSLCVCGVVKPCR